VNYITTTISIFCGGRIDTNYIISRVKDYFIRANSNIKIYVILNKDSKVKIDIKEQIKAFAIVRDKLIHDVNSYGEIQELKPNGYNFFIPSMHKDKTYLWAELVLICANSPVFMPNMTTNKSLFASVKSKKNNFKALKNRIAKETKRLTKIKKLTNQMTEQKQQIMDLNYGMYTDKFMKGIGTMLLKQLVSVYKDKNENGKQYLFMYLQALNTDLFKFYSKAGFSPVRNIYEHIALIKEKYCKSGSHVVDDKDLFPMITLLNDDKSVLIPNKIKDASFDSPSTKIDKETLKRLEFRNTRRNNISNVSNQFKNLQINRSRRTSTRL
jgi:hypothetical protein